RRYTVLTRLKLSWLAGCAVTAYCLLTYPASRDFSDNWRCASTAESFSGAIGANHIRKRSMPTKSTKHLKPVKAAKESASVASANGVTTLSPTELHDLI